MARNSEYSSYVFIKNDLKDLGWNTRNPNRDPNVEDFQKMRRRVITIPVETSSS